MKTVGRLFLLMIVLGLLLTGVFYARPLWVTLQVTHLRLFFARVQSNYVATPEGRIHYYDAESIIAGGGEPIVLVHGLGDRAESWAPMLMKLKKAGFHVYAPDLLGYGRSPKPEGSDYSIAEQEKLVEDFIHALGLQTPDVGGWSMGGWITLKLAAEHPEMVNRVMVYDSAGIKVDTGTADVFSPKTPEDMLKLQAVLEPEAKPLPMFVAKDALRSFQKQQWVVDRGVASMRTGRDILDDKLGQFSRPLLIVWGSEDRLLPLSVGERLHQMVPTSELDIVEGCGHLAPRTCADRVTSATADFLRSTPAPSGGTRTLARRDRE